MRKRKVLAVFMAIAMVFCYIPTTAVADSMPGAFQDMPQEGFWSTAALEAAVDNGLLNGFVEKDGTYIKPNDPLTRAQMAAIVNRAFGAENKATLTGVADVASNAWYLGDMQKAVQMGTMKLDTLMRPNDSITRQEAFTILARAFKMTDGTATDLAGFSDGSKVASWAVPGMGALVKAGYVQGSDNMLTPTAQMTRAQFAVIMNNMIQDYITQAGTVTAVASGNVMVNVPGVTLKDVTIQGDLIVGDGVGDGDVTLDNVTIKGDLIARGGGVNSIIIVGGGVDGKIVIAKVDGQVRVSVEGGAEVEVIVIDDGKDDVIIEGTVGTVEVTAPDTPVIVQNATVTNIEIKSVGAANVTVASGSTVTNVVVGTGSTGTTLNVEGRVTNVETSAANTNVGGTGTVNTVTTNEGANNTSVTTPSTKVNNDGATGVTAGGGTEVPSGSTATNSNTGGEATVVTTPTGGGSSGGGSGSGDTVVNVSAISVTGEGGATTITENGGTLQMTADVQPENASDKSVTWSVTETDDSATDKATINSTGLLTAFKNGTVKVKATSVSNPDVDGTLVVTISGQVPATYTVTFAAGTSNNDLTDITGATNYVASATATEGVAYTAPVLAAENYVFEGWFTDATCTTKYVKSATAITSDITLYAKFTEASFEHEKADGTKTYFTSLSGAFAKGSGTIKMLKDSTVSTRITIQNSIGQPVNNIILDLGGKTLTNTVADATYRAILIQKSNSLTVKNGTINFTAGDGFYLNNGHLTLDNDVDINATNHTAVVIVKGSTLTTAADINSGSDFAIAGNGTDGNGNTTVNVNGGTITSDVIAIYQPQSGALNISDGIITGSTAVYAKSGTTTISGGTMNGNGTAAAYTYNGDGAAATGDALVIDNCGYPGGAPVVSITGGTFNSTYAAAVGSYANGELSPITGFITGGTFSSNPTVYVASGYAAKGINGVWVVTAAEN